MKNTKRTVVVIALIALMAIPSMMAYFTDTEKVDNNVFTTGDIEVVLTDSVDETLENIVPAQDLGDVTVDVAGKNDAFLFVEITDADPRLAYTFDDEAWTKVGDTNVYAYEGNGTKGEVITGTNGIAVFTDVMIAPNTPSGDAIIETNDNAGDAEIKTVKFNYNVYAVQALGFDNAEAAAAQITR